MTKGSFRKSTGPVSLSELPDLPIYPDFPTFPDIYYFNNNEYPSLHKDEWYKDNGYDKKIKPENMKVFDHHINIQSYYDDGIKKYINTFSNVILVSKGDIYISGGDLKMSGIIFAPNGKVVFNGR